MSRPRSQGRSLVAATLLAGALLAVVLAAQPAQAQGLSAPAVSTDPGLEDDIPAGPPDAGNSTAPPPSPGAASAVPAADANSTAGAAPAPAPAPDATTGAATPPPALVAARLMDQPGCQQMVPESGALVAGMESCDVRGVLRRNGSAFYSFTVSPQSPGVSPSDFSLLITLRTLEGGARLGLASPGAGSINIRGIALYSTYLEAEQVIHLPASFLANNTGRYVIAITGAARTTFYTLRVQTPPENVVLEASQVEALSAIYEECCPAEAPGARRGGSGVGNASSVVVGGTGSSSPWCTDILPAALNPQRPPEDDLCHTTGFVCDLQGRLTKMALAGAGLQCDSFPLAFGSFTQLQTLDLAFNSFGGDTLANVADVLSNAQGLQRLFVRYANVTGTIPCSLVEGKANITILSVSGNELTGTLPACLLESPTLEELYASATNISGQLPDVALGPELRVLFLINSDPVLGPALTGPMPLSLNSADRLEYLDVSNHNLTGGVPMPPSAVMVNVSNCLLDGSLPDIPATLRVLDASYNELTGQVPDSFSQAASLAILDITSNSFEGNLPSLPLSMESLRARDNRLASLPATLPPSLRAIDVADNALQGPLPQLPPSSSLRTAVFSNNSLGEGLPLSLISAAPGLYVLDVSDNRLGGDLPEGPAALPPAPAPAAPALAPGGRRRLKQVEQQGGERAPWDLPSLAYLDISGNGFAGSVPAALGALPALLYMDASRNQFGGGLQPYAAALAAAPAPTVYVNVSNNRLEGPLPDELASAPMLASQLQVLLPSGSGAPRVLDLSNNSWSGPFPTWLLTQTARAADACDCPLYVSVNGPATQLTCPRVPAGQQLINRSDASTVRRMDFECYDPASQQQVPVASLLGLPGAQPPSQPSPYDTSTPSSLYVPSGGGGGSGVFVPAPAPQQGSLSGGAIAGIVIGTLAGVALLGTAGTLAAKRLRRRRQGWVKDDFGEGRVGTNNGFGGRGAAGPGMLTMSAAGSHTGGGVPPGGAPLVAPDRAAAEAYQRQQAAGIEMLRSSSSHVV